MMHDGTLLILTETWTIEMRWKCFWMYWCHTSLCWLGCIIQLNICNLANDVDVASYLMSAWSSCYICLYTSLLNCVIVILCSHDIWHSIIISIWSEESEMIAHLQSMFWSSSKGQKYLMLISQWSLNLQFLFSDGLVILYNRGEERGSMKD